LISLAFILSASFASLNSERARAEDSDDSLCTAAAFDRLHSSPEITATIAACSRIIDNAETAKEARARAWFVRGLNHFREAMNEVMVAKTPPGEPGPAARAAVDAALADLSRSIEAAPLHSAPALSLRATIHRVFNRSSEALADTGAAIRADPKDAVPHVVQAGIFEQQDRFTDARAELDTALALDPANAIALLNRAGLWTRYGDIDHAFADYDQAVSLGGATLSGALSGRARLALRLGHPRQAYADWTRAAELAQIPRSQAQLHIRAGTVARDYLKDQDLALAAYGRAMTALPTSAEPYLQRATAYERAARWREAEDDYRKALDLARNNPDEALSAGYIGLRIDQLRQHRSRRSDAPLLSPDVHKLAGVPPRDGSRRIALVIGNAAYRHVAALDNTDRDAASVGVALAGAGFADVTIAINLDRRDFVRVLDDFTARAAFADWALIYYAGHGIEVNGRNYLIPIDASPETLKRQLVGTAMEEQAAVPLDVIIAAPAPAKTLRLVALDACRDNPFVQEAHRVASRRIASGEPSAWRNAPPQPGPQTGGKDIGGGFSALTLTEPNTLVLYSTQPGQVALDGDDLNSPFTRAFLRNNAVPGQDLATFLARLHDDVATATQGQQLPAVNGQLRPGDSFYFFPPL